MIIPGSRFTAILICALALLLPASTAFPQAKAVHPNSLLNYDANGDGVLTFDEIRAKYSAYTLNGFRKVDSDGNGKLSAAEVGSWYRGRLCVRNVWPGDLVIESHARAGARSALRAAVVDAALGPEYEQPGGPDLSAPIVPYTEIGPATIGEIEVLHAVADPANFFKRCDTNRDEKLTLQEVQTAFPGFTAYAFAYFDRDKDTFLTQNEFRSFIAVPPPRSAALDNADANGDKLVNYTEATAAAPDLYPARFAALDRDKNAGLSASEIAVTKSVSGPDSRVSLVGIADNDRDHQVTFSESRVFEKMNRTLFDSIDTNKDGAISSQDNVAFPVKGVTEAELTAALQADEDHDRRVSFDEIRAARPKFSEELFRRLDVNRDGVLSTADII